MLGGRRTDEDQCEREQDERRQHECQPQRQQPYLPPGPPFVDVVRAVERVDQAHQGRRAAPERDDKPEGQDSAVVTFGDLPDLGLEDRDDIAGHDATERADDPVHEVLEREEARKGDADQNRREQREEEVIGELRGQAEAVVRHELLGSPRQELAPRERQAGEAER